jgi:autotransporter-associated beta strand protein
MCGAPTMTLNNGSTYLPGSWADDVTSYGCYFLETSQTKATKFIASGAAGTTGAVIEPYAIAARFTNTSIQTFIADGSTLGEAFAKSVASPDVQMPLGDMLAQPNADLPVVAFTSAPGKYGAARGAISLGASAALVSPRIATGICKFEFLVDGMVQSTVLATGGGAIFNLDTNSLSDGVHEVRAVAINNAQAASEGYAAMPIVVNNHGRSISFTSGNVTLGATPAMIGLATAAGDGNVLQTELTCLGRVISQASGLHNSLSIDPSVLAPGDNVITPVAIFSDGSQVAGGAFTVHVESGAANTWTNAAGAALWSNPANWSGGTLPQNGDGVARFGGATVGQLVTLDAPATVQEIDFDNSSGGNYTLAAMPGQVLTLSSTNGPMSESLINVASGRHTISAPLSLATAGNLVVVNGPTDSLTITGGVSGSGGLTKIGASTLILTGSNTYSGATDIKNGTLRIGDGASSTYLSNTSEVLNEGSLVFNQANNAVFGAAISGDGTLTKLGRGTLTLTGNNTYSGGTVLSDGKLVISSASALPDGGDLAIGDTWLFPTDGVQFVTVSSSSPTVTVPEPCTFFLASTIAACIAGFAAKWGRSRERKPVRSPDAK